MKFKEKNIHSFLINTCLVIGSFSLCFLVLEASIRIAEKVPLFERVNYIDRALQFLTVNTMASYSPTLGWISSPHVSSGPNKEWLTGDYGIRMNSNTILPIPQNAILATGDSFGVGAEVANHESYPAQLEKMLQTPVVNSGCGGWGVDQMILRAEELTPILHPRTILIGIASCDIFRDAYMAYGGGYKPYFVDENGELALKGVPVPKPENQKFTRDPLRITLGYSYFMYWAMGKTGNLGWWMKRKFQYPRIQTDEKAAEGCGMLMDRLKKFSEQNNVKVVIVIQYSPDEILHSENPWWKIVDKRPWYVAPVLKRAQENGFIVVDTFDAFKEVFNRGMDDFYKLWMMKDNNRIYGHMSPEGNRLTAQLIYEKMKK